MPPLDENTLGEMGDAELVRHLTKTWDEFKGRAQSYDAIDKGTIDQVDAPFRDLVRKVETSVGASQRS